MSFIYSILNTFNQKVYVGQTYDFEMRKKSHLHSVNKKNTPLYRAMRKYGIEYFEFKILEECDQSIVNEREIYWIKELKSFNSKFGYNQTSGGEEGKRLSKETKQKLRDVNLGKHHTEETKKKIKDKLKGKKKTYKVSEETRLKQSNKAKGKILSDSTKDLIRNSSSKKKSVLKINSLTNEVICIYVSLRLASKTENIPYSILRRRLITEKIIDDIIWKFESF